MDVDYCSSDEICKKINLEIEYGGQIITASATLIALVGIGTFYGGRSVSMFPLRQDDVILKGVVIILSSTAILTLIVETLLFNIILTVLNSPIIDLSISYQFLGVYLASVGIGISIACAWIYSIRVKKITGSEIDDFESILEKNKDEYGESYSEGAPF